MSILFKSNSELELELVTLQSRLCPLCALLPVSRGGDTSMAGMAIAIPGFSIFQKPVTKWAKYGDTGTNSTKILCRCGQNTEIQKV